MSAIPETKQHRRLASTIASDVTPYSGLNRLAVRVNRTCLGVCGHRIFAMQMTSAAPSCYTHGWRQDATVSVVHVGQLCVCDAVGPRHTPSSPQTLRALFPRVRCLNPAATDAAGSLHMHEKWRTSKMRVLPLTLCTRNMCTPIPPQTQTLMGWCPLAPRGNLEDLDVCS